ncbi:MAG: hypothetical protein FWE22_08540 [Firmicutes bacterium]|nr:hypothetical protein [Bacillota bacterium]
MLNKKINKILSKNFDHFNTPGHKGSLMPHDISEIANGKYFPADLIENAQKKASEVFKCKEVRFLTHGASLGIKAAILAVDGDIITSHNSHTSVFEGVNLSKVKCGIMQNNGESDLRNGGEKNVGVSNANPNKNDNYSALKRNTFPPSYHNHYIPTIADLQQSLKNHPFAKAVVLTTPDYFGRILSLDIIKAVKDAGKILILDSAHGAHFSFRKDLFPSTFMEYADFCIFSAHKSLNAYTQTAYLCINNASLIQKTDEALQLLGTTSPFYPFLAQLENAVYYHTENAGKYDALKKLCDNFRKEIKAFHSDDFTRLVVDMSDFSFYSAWELYDKLLKNGIVAEAYCADSIIFITTIEDDKKKFNRLIKVLKELKC